MTNTNKQLSEIIRTARSMTLTPVSEVISSDAHMDYEREMGNWINGFNAMWDDKNNNGTRVNDLFAYIQGHAKKETEVGEGYCQIRRVIAILPAGARPINYWHNPAHNDRNVLVLGDILYEGTWVELNEAVGNQGWGKVLYAGTPNEIRFTSPITGTRIWPLN